MQTRVLKVRHDQKHRAAKHKQFGKTVDNKLLPLFTAWSLIAHLFSDNDA
ncbi:MAG: hypothetical protein GXP08_04955 [Gammaproteobacteria bacterium]|nr:hypothetical protein [Gammaproteobacteria bacterium]